MVTFKSFQGIRDKNFSLITYVMFIISFFGIVWLSLQEIRAGQFYFILIVGFMAAIFFGFLFIKEKTKDIGLTLPFSKNSYVGSIRYWLGFLIPFILASIAGFSAWRQSKVISPFLLFDIGGEFENQSFAALQAAYDPFMRFFSIVFTAGTIEEIVLGLEVVLIGIILGMFLIRNFSIKLNSFSGRFTVYGFAFVFSMVFFAILHLFNPQYVTMGAFMIAAGFRLLMNILMFFVLGIEFTIGVHHSNNLIAIGVGTLVALLSTYQGLLIIAFWIILMIIAVRGIVTKKVSLRDIFTIK